MRLRSGRIGQMIMFEFSRDQLKQLADFVANFGLVFAASVIAPLFSDDIDKIDIVAVGLGLVLSLLSLFLSLKILGINKRERR